MQLDQWEDGFNAVVLLNLISEQPEPHCRAIEQAI